MPKLRRFIAQLVSVSILTLGFSQFSLAGVVGSQDLLAAESRAERISQIESLMAREDVATQLQKFGVSPQLVAQRVQNMTDAELLELQHHVDDSIAGSGAVEIVGAVFIVLLILELVGVTDIFKAI